MRDDHNQKVYEEFESKLQKKNMNGKEIQVLAHQGVWFITND